MGNLEPLFKISIAGRELGITNSVVAQWVVMLVIFISVMLLTRKLNNIPRGSQIWIEIIVEKINGLVKDNMGEKYLRFAPYIGTIMIYLLLLNLFGLTGFSPPTADYSVALGLALISFIVIQATAIKENGLMHYFGGLGKPYVFMLPLNMLERLVLPVSLSLRLFGNMTAGLIIVELLYRALEYISETMHLKIPILQLAIPVPLHMYFDIFDGAIQMFIFVMLTMIFIKTTSEH